MAKRKITHQYFGDDEDKPQEQGAEVQIEAVDVAEEIIEEPVEDTIGQPSHAAPKTKRNKVVTLRSGSDSEDEEPHAGPSSLQLPYSPANIQLPYAGPSSFSSANDVTQKSKKAKRQHLREDDEQQKRKRVVEAKRLEEGRMKLPFWEARDRIVQSIMENDTVVILGETGSGKSTQLPSLLRRHELSAPRKLSIAITQPRRLPAMSLATRVAAEMGVACGGEVGYSVRFEDCTSKDTKVRYLTEGVLMRELANADKYHSAFPTPPSSASPPPAALPPNLLLRYDVIVLDEAHERTLNTDFLLGSLKRIQRIRKELAVDPANQVQELKVIVMSATLDAERFSRFFGSAPVVYVRGRLFGVTISHTVAPQDDFVDSALRTAFKIHLDKSAVKGDILIFMPGQEEIDTLVASLQSYAKQLKRDDQQILALPLYSTLSPQAQAKIFIPAPENTRKIIVSTNIAETSLTIPGVRFVIDSGFKKEKEWISRGSSGGLDHLKKQPVSQSSAMQRAGRAGRESSGWCYRLYTHDFYKSLPRDSVPEIQRCNLASAVLTLIAMNANPFEFEFLDPPDHEAIIDAYLHLIGLGALESKQQVSPLGRHMLRYPLDPVYSRILVASFDHGCPSEVIDVLSLAVSGPLFIDRADTRESAFAARTKFVHRDGDHLTALNVLRAYNELVDQPKTADAVVAVGGVVGWSRDNFVNSKTLAAARKVRDQLRELVTKDGQDWSASCASEHELVLKCLVQGLYLNTALIQPDGTYKQTVGSLFPKIHPSSTLMSKKVPAIIYDELAVTSGIYARNVSVIQQAWLAEIPQFNQKKLALLGGGETKVV